MRKTISVSFDQEIIEEIDRKSKEENLPEVGQSKDFARRRSGFDYMEPADIILLIRGKAQEKLKRMIEEEGGHCEKQATNSSK